MIKNLKIISLFFLTFYIRSSENNSTVSIFSSVLQLEQYLQTLPTTDQKNYRTLYLENQENSSRITSYYRDLTYDHTSMSSYHYIYNLLLEKEFPKKNRSMNHYSDFKELLIFEIEHQKKIIDFILVYTMDNYSKEKFITDFTKTFNINRSKKRFEKELAKAFLYIENKAILYQIPAEVSYFLDPNSSDKPLAKLEYLSVLANKNKGLD